MVDMQKNKKRLAKFRDVIFYLFIAYIGFVILIDLVQGAGAGAWVETGSSRFKLYNVTQSGGDVFAWIGEGVFTTTAPQQPLRMTGYDIWGGLVFEIADRVVNDTHREVATHAYLEFYSDDQTSQPSGSITFYQQNKSAIGPYSVYGDLANAQFPWVTGTAQLSELGRAPHPLGWEGWRSVSLQFLTSAVNKMGDGFHPYLDNNTLGLRYSSISGDLEYFETWDSNVSRAPRIGITWTMEEFIDGSPPTGYNPDDFQFMQDGFYIWGSPLYNENRTGANSTVNWNLLNVTELTEIDSGASLSRDNDTLITISTLVGQEIDSIYNDTGGLGVNGFFVRFSLNTTNIANNMASTDRVMMLAGLSTATPVGGGGLLYGNNGDFVGLAMQVFTDDDRYSFRLMDRSGIDRQYSSSSQTFNDFDSERLYFEYVARNSWEKFRIYSDPEFTDLLFVSDRVYATASGPFRYPQISASVNFGTHRVNDAQFFTYLDSPIDVNATVYVVADENGTLLCTLYPNTIECNYTVLDDLEEDINRLLGGIDTTYDKLPDLGNTFILMMGIMGMIMIPGSFIMLGHSIKEGDWVTGFYYLLMMFFVGLGFVTVWLFG